MDPETSAFSPAVTGAPPSTSSQHPPVQHPSADDLFSVFGLPPLDTADTRISDLQKPTGGVAPKTETSQSGFVKMLPPARPEAPRANTPSTYPSDMPNIAALSLNKQPTYGRPGPYKKPYFQQAFPPRQFPSTGAAPGKHLCQMPILTPVPAASASERQQTSSRPPGQCDENDRAPETTPSFEAMTDLLSKLDAKHTQAAPDLAALEKLVEAQMDTMPKTDPKRKILAQQFIELKHAHSQVQIGVLQMRANVIAEAREERKQKAALQLGDDQMELE